MFSTIDTLHCLPPSHRLLYGTERGLSKQQRVSIVSQQPYVAESTFSGF